MPDIRLVQRGEFPNATDVSVDWLLQSDGTLDETQALQTAVVVALGTDRLADITDRLPDPDSTDRRGWWGDIDADVIWGAWPIGCRLWLMHREKITDNTAQQGSTMQRIKIYIQEALQPLLNIKLASRVDIFLTRISSQQITALIRLYRGPKTAVELQYQILWQGIIE